MNRFEHSPGFDDDGHPYAANGQYPVQRDPAFYGDLASTDHEGYIDESAYELPDPDQISEEELRQAIQAEIDLGNQGPPDDLKFKLVDVQVLPNGPSTQE